MKISLLAVADIHSPRYLPLFAASINSLLNKQFDLIILAGDIVENGSPEMLKPVIEIINRLMNRVGMKIPIISIFGNEEYMGRESLFREVSNELIWLDDEYRVIEIKNKNLCIIGSRGVLKKPTPWQKKNIPDIYQIYQKRLDRIKNMIIECSKYDISILVTHYASSFITLYGENPVIYDYLGYPLIENLQMIPRPKIAIHGHAHNSKRLYAFVNGVQVYNVSLIANKNVSIIEVT